MKKEKKVKGDGLKRDKLKENFTQKASDNMTELFRLKSDNPGASTEIERAIKSQRKVNDWIFRDIFGLEDRRN